MINEKNRKSSLMNNTETEKINFRDTYKSAIAGSKESREKLKCLYSGVDLIEEIQMYLKRDPYYLEFLLDNNDLVSYPVFKNRYAADYIPTRRRRYITESDPDINSLLNIPGEFHPFCFDNIYVNTIQKALFDKSKFFISKSTKRSMLISGEDTGQGKTLAAVCIAKESFIIEGFNFVELFHGALAFLNSSIIFINEFSLLEIIDLLLDDQYRIYSIEKIYRRLSDTELLIIDDMFQTRSMDKYPKLLDIYMPIIYNRLEVRKLRTVITTNKTPEQFTKISKYIYSRLKRGDIYNCTWSKDYRGSKD
jgi:DNA replication protein DnaC